VVHKERQLRKRDSRMIRLMYENPSPTNRPPIPHAPSDEEESEPETFESIWERSQQVDSATNKDYWDGAYGNSYYNPTFGGVYSARSSYSEVPFMGTQGQGTSSSMPPVDPNAQGSSSAAVDTTMVHYLAQSIHMRECRLTILHSRHHHLLCLQANL
jgi:hypothetical protein